MRLLLAALLLLAAPGALAAGSAPRIEKALVLDGLITPGSIGPIADELLRASLAEEGTVDLIINSPGGSVVEGFAFISKMEAAKANGLVIRCFVPEYAASMAFQILVHCSPGERYALPRAFLLWHHARVVLGGGTSSPPGKVMTSEELAHVGLELRMLDYLILTEILAVMPEVPSTVVRYHFDMQTLQTGLALSQLAPSFLKVYPRIAGLEEILLGNRLLMQGRTPASTDLRPGQMVYVSPYILGGK